MDKDMSEVYDIAFSNPLTNQKRGVTYPFFITFTE